MTFQIQHESKVCNVILSITRFTKWKRKSYLDMKILFLDIDKTEKWIYNEIRKHYSFITYKFS